MSTLSKKPSKASKKSSQELSWLQAGFVRTYTGRKFYPLNPEPDQIDIVDIANSLAKICRYAGHLPWMYSVAEHSIHCSHLVKPDIMLEALLHDAAEAYISDLPRPVKRCLPEYKTLETKVEAVIAEKFQLATDVLTHQAVKYVDNKILLKEFAVFFPTHVEDLNVDVTPSERSFPHIMDSPNYRPLDPEMAKQLFLQQYEILRRK